MSHPLTTFRAGKNLTQESLGEQLGVSSMTVSRWERGETLPRPKLWPKIQEATGLSPNDFVRFEREAAQ